MTVAVIVFAAKEWNNLSQAEERGATHLKGDWKGRILKGGWGGGQVTLEVWSWIAKIHSYRYLVSAKGYGRIWSRSRDMNGQRSQNGLKMAIFATSPTQYYLPIIASNHSLSAIRGLLVPLTKLFLKVCPIAWRIAIFDFRCCSLNMSCQSWQHRWNWPKMRYRSTLSKHI